MKKLSRIIALLIVLVMAMGTLLIPATATNEGEEYTLAGIGTNALKHWSFYYTTAPEGSANPTEGMLPLTKPGRSATSSNCWPFPYANDLIAYDNTDWGAGEEQTLVYFYNAQYLFVFPNNNNNVHTSPILVFTAPQSGKYNISFDGSVSWSANNMFVNAYLNGQKVANSYYLFDTTQSVVGQGKKAYSLDVELEKGEQLCLVFEYPGSNNRGNIENLKATLIEAEACDHTGGTATCSQKATCTKCGNKYGTLKPHTGDPCSVCGSTKYTLKGIGTDSLKYWSFHYTTAPAGSNPTTNTSPLSNPARKGNVSNGCWPFNLESKLQAYDNPSWAKGEEENIVWFADEQYLFVCPKNKNGTYYRPIIKFTAPKAGNYTISFDGSVSWSPDVMTMNAYLNGIEVSNSGYVFSTTQGKDQIGAEGATKEYQLTVDLKRGDELCLVFEYPTENRGNIENLTATLNYIADGETPDAPEDSTTTNPPATSTPPTTSTDPSTSESESSSSQKDPEETIPDETTTDNGSVTTPDDTSSVGNGGNKLKPTYDMGVILAVVIPFAIIAVIVVIVVTKK